MTTAADDLIHGAIDMHCHHGPDPHRKRSVDAEEAAREADAIGMRALVLKSHAYPTGPVAILMQKQVRQLRVFGGICCDFEVGGLNPAAVEVALRTGAKVVWMPTFSSLPDRRKLRLPGPGIALLDERARPVSPLHEICASPRRTMPSLPPVTWICEPSPRRRVRELGVPTGDDACARNARRRRPYARARRRDGERGAMIEFTYLTCMPAASPLTRSAHVRAMAAVGPERAIMSTDFGQGSQPASGDRHAVVHR
jgi:hypothetical protein